MQNLKVTLVQIDQVWEDKDANFKRYKEQLKTVHADLIVLPEMFQTGFSMNVQELAESWSNSLSINWLKDVANEKQSAIYTSLIIKNKGNYYNRGVFVFPNGKIEYYDKRKSFALAGEDQFFTAGDTTKIVEYLGWRFQLQICFDLRFPEISRNYIGNDNKPNYDVLLYVANWPEKRILHWDTLIKARAIENQCYVVGVNRIGVDNNHHTYSGHSKVISPLGDIHALEIGKNQSETIILQSEKLIKTRESLPFLYKR